MMKRSILAPVLSGLVFPGLGQLINRQFVKGAAMVLGTAVLVVLVFLKSSAFMAQDLASLKDMSPEGLINWAISAAPRFPVAARVGVWGIFGVWVFGIIDAHLVGRRREREGTSE